MCGRFAFAPKVDSIENDIEIINRDETIKISYNLSPGMKISTIDKSRSIKNLYWGLIPYWSKDISIGRKLYNARSETAHEKPSFKKAFTNRCLIPATGFYEWKKSKNRKSPYFVQPIDMSIFYLAGIYDKAEIDGHVIKSVTILTTEPNNLIKKIHNRMPVIIEKKNLEFWLDADNSAIINSNIFTPYSNNKIEAYRVSDLVNNPSLDNSQLIENIDITLF